MHSSARGWRCNPAGLLTTYLPYNDSHRNRYAVAVTSLNFSHLPDGNGPKGK
jgi:hypothetical protein